jgi:hypothetical protein
MGISDRRRFWTLALATAAALLATVPGRTQQPSEALRAKSSDAGSIAAMTAQGRVRILVHYRVPAEPAPGATPGASESATIRQNRATQEAIIRDHFGPLSALTGPERALRQLEVTPAFAINASEAEIDALARDSRVLDIALDQPRRPVPDTAR